MRSAPSETHLVSRRSSSGSSSGAGAIELMKSILNPSMPHLREVFVGLDDVPSDVRVPRVDADLAVAQHAAVGDGLVAVGHGRRRRPEQDFHPGGVDVADRREHFRMRLGRRLAVVGSPAGVDQQHVHAEVLGEHGLAGHVGEREVAVMAVPGAEQRRPGGVGDGRPRRGDQLVPPGGGVSQAQVVSDAAAVDPQDDRILADRLPGLAEELCPAGHEAVFAHAKAHLRGVHGVGDGGRQRVVAADIVKREHRRVADAARGEGVLAGGRDVDQPALAGDGVPLVVDAVHRHLPGDLRRRRPGRTAGGELDLQLVDAGRLVRQLRERVGEAFRQALNRERQSRGFDFHFRSLPVRPGPAWSACGPGPDVRGRAFGGRAGSRRRPGEQGGGRGCGADRGAGFEESPTCYFRLLHDSTLSNGQRQTQGGTGQACPADVPADRAWLPGPAPLFNTSARSGYRAGAWFGALGSDSRPGRGVWGHRSGWMTTTAQAKDASGR